MLHTYSYGNGGSSGWFVDAPADVMAANQALHDVQYLHYVGGADYVPYVEIAFSVLSGFSLNYSLPSNNCKDGTNTLIGLTNYIYYH